MRRRADRKARTTPRCPALWVLPISASRPGPANDSVDGVGVLTWMIAHQNQSRLRMHPATSAKASTMHACDFRSSSMPMASSTVASSGMPCWRRAAVRSKLRANSAMAAVSTPYGTTAVRSVPEASEDFAGCVRLEDELAGSSERCFHLLADVGGQPSCSEVEANPVRELEAFVDRPRKGHTDPRTSIAGRPRPKSVEKDDVASRAADEQRSLANVILIPIDVVCCASSRIATSMPSLRAQIEECHRPARRRCSVPALARVGEAALRDRVDHHRGLGYA